VLSVLLRYTDSDYPFGIYKLFYIEKINIHIKRATGMLIQTIVTDETDIFHQAGDVHRFWSPA
jgi:hypothetical protein